MKIKIILPVLLVLMTQIPAQSQNRRHSISGFVRDSESGETLPGAGITYSSGITISNEHGFFSLPTNKDEETLSCSFIGYRVTDFRIKASRDTTVDILLVPGEVLSEAVVSAGHAGRSGKLELTAGEVLSSPVVLSEPDILKTLQMMPGVQGGLDGTSGIFVRGGGPDENLFLLDGVPMYNVSHMLGIFSAFTPEAVKKITLYKGAFPARYGGRVSSIVDIRMGDGDVNDFHGALSLGLLSSRLHIDGPIIKGKTTVSMTARCLNSIFAAPFLIKNGYNYSYYFYDLNGKIVHRFSANDNLAFTFYNCRDDFRHLSDEYLETKDEGRYIAQDATSTDWGNTLLSLKWNHVFGPKLFFSTSLSWYGYDADTEIKKFKTRASGKTLDEVRFRSDIKDIVLRSEFDYMLSQTHTLHLGAEGTRHQFAPSTEAMNEVSAISVSDAEDSAPVYDGMEASIYLEDEINAWNWLHADLGLRYTFMKTNGRVYPSLEPRVSLIADILKGISISASYSRMSQYVHLLSSSQVSLPSDIWVPITDRIRPVMSDQVSIGFTYDRPSWEAGVEAYYKHSDNILEYKNGVSFLSGTRDWGEMVAMGESRSRGIEFLLRKKSGKTTGMLSYTLSKTERRFPDGSINYGQWYPFSYDRRHNIIMTANRKLGKSWEFGASWTFASGVRITLPDRAILTASSSSLFLAGGGNFYSQKNNTELPPSHHLDLSLNWHRKFRHGRRVWNFSLYNAYNAMNPNIVQVGYFYNEGGEDKFKVQSFTYLPILPSMSYTYYF